MTPWSLAVAVTAPIAGRLADRHAAGLLGGIGLAVFAAGLFMLYLLPPTASNLDIIWRMALCGLGFGFFQSPNNRTLLSAAPLQRSGAAGGMLAMARLVGQTSGALGMGLLFHLAAAHAALTALAIASAVAAAASLVSLSRLRLAEKSGAAPDPLLRDAA
jgi:DHA2 family multidrug resistance protein-like MFS transporter